MDRVRQSREDLKVALKEQAAVLVHLCAGYDAGKLALAKPMATALRICLHHKNRSTSLLQQLGLRNGRFYSAPGKHAQNVAPIGCALTPMSFSEDRRGHYVPSLTHPRDCDRLPFAEWWTSVVLRAPTGETMSRMDIITAVTDMDGGAHIDPALTPLYARFRSGRLLGMYASPTEDGQIHMTMTLFRSPEVAAKEEDEEKEGLLPSPQYPSVRTVAHEVLLTLQREAPWSFDEPYEPVMMPASAEERSGPFFPGL